MKSYPQRSPNELLLVRLAENRWSGALERWLRAACAGGVILDTPLPRSAGATHELAANIARVTSPLPFLAVREEGGNEGALGVFLPALPSLRFVANKGVPAVARLGELIGEALSLLGFNTNFAPALDLATPFTEKTLGAHAFSADPRQVAECGGAFARGLRQHKIRACGKHFPGWGSVPVDALQGLAVSGKSMAALWREDLFPFRELLPQLPMVQVSSAAYKAYDFDIPRAASLSPAVVEGLLRIRLGYRGLALAYDLEDQNVRGTLDLGQAAIQAINAGCDLIIVDQGTSFDTVSQALQAGLDAGKLAPKRLEESLERIRIGQKGLTPPKGKIAKSALDELARRFERFSSEFSREELKIA